MLEVWGDLWRYPADAYAVTTNGTVRQGHAVMGVGTARQAKALHPPVPRALGRSINIAGNQVYFLGAFDGTDGVTRRIVAFPVKRHVWQSAEISLIRSSCLQLAELLDEQGWRTLVLPRPGCGAGGAVLGPRLSPHRPPAGRPGPCHRTAGRHPAARCQQPPAAPARPARAAPDRAGPPGQAVTDDPTRLLVEGKDPYRGGIQRLRSAWPEAELLWVFPVLDPAFDATDLACVARLAGTTVILATSRGQPEALSRQFLQEHLDRYEMAATLTRQALSVVLGAA